MSEGVGPVTWILGFVVVFLLLAVILFQHRKANELQASFVALDRNRDQMSSEPEDARQSHTGAFRRDMRGHLFRQSPTRDGLNAHMFYRHAAMFVAFMTHHQPVAVGRLLNAIMEPQDFHGAVQGANGCDIEALWTEFIVDDRGRQS